MYTDQQREAFQISYIETMFWADCGEDGQPESDAELSGQALERIQSDCKQFLSLAPYFSSLSRLTLAAHDFWLTRQGHGAGFWDGDWSQEIDIACCAICDKMGEVYLYQGDDDFVYFF